MRTGVWTKTPIDHLPCEGSEQHPWEGLDEAKFQDYDALFLIGSSRLDVGTELTPSQISRLWSYVESGGILYAELVEAFDFPSSRLFGWKQDFPKTRRTLEKIRIAEASAGLEEGAIMEWSGAYAMGFSIESKVMLELGQFRATHQAEGTNQGPVYPGLSVRRLGKGLVIYSAISLYSCEMKEALRPYTRWKTFIETLAESVKLPLAIWPERIRITNRIEAGQAVDACMKWFQNSGIMPSADGSEGVLENIHSVTGALSRDRRPDCHAHAALFFHLFGQWKNEPVWQQISHRLMDYLFENGYQDMDVESPSYGFFKWFDFPGASPEQLFTDDNAWVCFTLLYLYRKTGITEYKERGLLLAEAMLSTQGENGVRPSQITRSQLQKLGKAEASKLSPSLNPHFESIAHAAFLQAYLVTGKKEFADTALKGSLYLISRIDDLVFMYSRTSGISRFVLPLGFLSRNMEESGITGSALERIADYLLSNQSALGGIEEADNPDPGRFGKEDAGVYIHNGEGIADQLYTNNFLLMNAWEAWKATGNPKFKKLYDGVSDFMCRIQIESPDPRYDGGWMRAYDLRNGEYFGNNGDTGWGPYCMESGWTQAIASAGLLLGLLDESLFE